jgi:ribosomal protein S9
LRKAFLSYDRNLLVADVRRKEAYKPGDSKARAKRQSSKR